MKHIELINGFRENLSRLVVEVETSVAMNQLDINIICEDVICGLMRELYDFEALRNLNSEEKVNYPGIDLADDEARVAIQVTSDKSLKKVKDTLCKIIKHRLTEKYNRIIIYCLTRRQQSYSKGAISAVCGEEIRFDVSSDILDYRDIAARAVTVAPERLQAAFDHISAYMDGSDTHASGNQINIDKLTISFPDPTLVDEKILHRLRILRTSLQFAEFDRLGDSRRLAEHCISGQLSGGSPSIRSRALAWCARILSNDDPEESENVLRSARALSSESEIDIAEAFLISKRDGRSQALAVLAGKNTPQAASAALFIVNNHDGKAQALEWFRKTDMSPKELDADGKNLLLSLQLELADWSGAAKTAGLSNDADCEETSILLVNLAFESLLKIVPEEYRSLVYAHLPFQNTAVFLASGEEALKIHRDAQNKFRRATERFRQINLLKAADVSEGYDLWLALSHPELQSHAQDRLRSILRDPARSLRLVPLALTFGVELDLDEVARAVDRQVALCGGPTGDTAVARLSLALEQPSKEKAAAYIDRHRDELESCLDPRAIAFIEIEMLSRSGQTDAAQHASERLKAAVQLGADEEARLKIILAEGTNEEPTAAWRVQYEKTKSLTDLNNLVDALYDKEEWSQMTAYATTLFEATKSIPSAEQLGFSLVSSGQGPNAIEFIEANESLLEHSVKLRTLKCWALYQSGRLLEARQALSLISVDQDAKNYHALRRNIAMASGDWQVLAQIVGEEAAHNEERSAGEIIQAAYLGFQVRSPAARDLLFVAAQKGADDPQILASAYFLATNAGIEENPEITGWLHRATELSEEDGPIQTVSLQEISKIRPEWKDQQERTWKMLRNAEVLMFVAAQSLNRSLIEMILVPLLANLQEDDPRFRIPVYAFSGKRTPASVPFPDEVGLDASALLTLGGLELLDVLQSAPFKIRIPHSTLQWLFVERGRSAFHQPSRFQRAQNLQDMIVTGRVEVRTLGPMTDSRLSAKVGEELAAMIGEAEEISQEGGIRDKYVVRSPPVHRVGSLMNEDVDMSEHRALMVSCQGVVDKLRDMGRLTGVETKCTHAFLQLNEQRWPDEPKIEDGSILFLDSLSVDYFQTCKLLEKIADAGFDIVVSEPLAAENRSLLSLQRMSDQLERLIEDIRAFLQDGIETGAIVVDPLRHKYDEQDLRGHPTSEASLLSEDCDVVVFDDRFINQHPNVDLPGGATKPILTSLELLSLCADTGYLDAERLQEATTILRRGGFLFLEIDEEELFAEICVCKDGDAGLRETAELRAIREAFLFPRLARALRYEDEIPWLDRSIITILKVYRRVWSSEGCLSDVKARAAWLMELADVRGWLVTFPNAQARYILHEGRVKHLMVQISPLVEVERERKEAFNKWIDEHLVTPLRREDPALFERLVHVEKSMILSYLDHNTLSRDNDAIERGIIGETGLALVPEAIRGSIIQDVEFLEAFGLSLRSEAIISFSVGIRMKSNTLFDAVAEADRTNSVVTVCDENAQEWHVAFDMNDQRIRCPQLTREGHTSYFPDGMLLLSDLSAREHQFHSMADDAGLLESHRERWIKILREHALSNNEMRQVHRDLEDTPYRLMLQLRESLLGGKTTSELLVPESRRYYERLIGYLGDAESVQEHAGSGAQDLITELIAWSPLNGFLLSLPLASHAAYSAVIPVANLPEDVIREAYDNLVSNGDMLSRLAAVEIGLPLLSERPWLTDPICDLINIIRTDDPEAGDDGFSDLSRYFIFADSEISRLGILRGAPCFYRRAASFAQATLIQRQLNVIGADPDGFRKWIDQRFRPQFYAQSLVDMRLAPRWHPDLINAVQIKQDFVGRILGAAEANKERLGDGRLAALLRPKTDHKESVVSAAKFPLPFFSGPLEGNVPPPLGLPEDAKEIIDEQLFHPELTTKSFITAVNLANIYAIQEELVTRIAMRLKGGNYHFQEIQSEDEFSAFLSGLANFAAATRSVELANDIQILVRKYRRDPAHKISITTAFHTVFLAAAAHEDLDGWCSYIGNAVDELAFGAITKDEAGMLRSLIWRTSEAEPELWTRIGAAEAALSTYLVS